MHLKARYRAAEQTVTASIFIDSPRTTDYNTIKITIRRNCYDSNFNDILCSPGPTDDPEQ